MTTLTTVIRAWIDRAAIALKSQPLRHGAIAAMMPRTGTMAAGGRTYCLAGGL